MVMLGTDIGGAQIKAGMVDEEGAILAARTIPTPADLDTFLPSLHEAVRWLLEATTLPAGVGVGCKESSIRQHAGGDAPGLVAFSGGVAPERGNRPAE